MYTTVLFDLDGTVTDPGEGITKSVEYALSKWNIKVKDRTSLYKFIGPPLMYSFTHFYDMSEAEARKAVEFYHEYYVDKGIHGCELYPGIKNLLASLKEKKYKISLASSKPDVLAIQVLKNFDVYQYFDFIGAATLDDSRSKKSEVIEYTLDNLEEKDRSKIIMIGDRCYDILGAKQFGLDSIGVLYGYGSLDELKEAGATHIVDSAYEIERIIVNG